MILLAINFLGFAFIGSDTTTQIHDQSPEGMLGKISGALEKTEDGFAVSDETVLAEDCFCILIDESGLVSILILNLFLAAALAFLTGSFFYRRIAMLTNGISGLRQEKCCTFRSRSCTNELDQRNFPRCAYAACNYYGKLSDS